MKVFFTRPCYHFKTTMNVEVGRSVIKTFADGELCVILEDNVADQQVWVIAATPPPAETWLELFFMLDALHRFGATINLFMTYCGYARQDQPLAGQPLSAQLMLKFLRQVPIAKTVMFHIHNPALKKYYDFENVIWLDFFVDAGRGTDYIVAPDKGAETLAVQVAQQVQAEVLVLQKERTTEGVTISGIDRDLAGKRVLIVDDMIATGGTIIQASHALKSQGAAAISVAATHGIFCDGAIEKLQESPIQHILVTNSLSQAHDHAQIEVIDCSEFIDRSILEPR